MEHVLNASPSPSLLLSLLAGLATLVSLLLVFSNAARLTLVRFRVWVRSNLFTLHLLGMTALSLVSLGVCLLLKPLVQHLDPQAQPYDETLLQKLPLTLAVLCILFPAAMLVIRVTLPGMYRYLNYTQPGHSPDSDHTQSSPTARLCIALAFYCFIVYCGIQVFTGNV